MDYKKLIIECLTPALEQEIEENLIEIPPDPKMGDFGVPMFQFARKFKKAPNKIAEEIIPNIKLPDPFETIKNIGPYINFFVKKSSMAKFVIQKITSNIEEYAISQFKKTSKKEKIVIEYPSPNTNKPLHLGHVRNMLLGQTLAKLHRVVGNDVYEVNLLNDRGIHICKSMWAYQKYGKEKTPEEVGIKSDHFVGDFYVKYTKKEAELKKSVENKLKLIDEEKLKPKEKRDQELLSKLKNDIDISEFGKLQNEIKDMLIKWEDNDTEVRKLWRKMNDWAEDGYKKTFDLFGIKHDKTYYESNIYDKGKEIVLEGLENNKFEKLDDGAIVARFNKKGFPKQKVLLRSDGTTLYVTQDLFLAFEKMKDYNYDQSIYVIGNEQNMQLRVVFELLNVLGMKARNIHYSYGMINLTTGKMKSREGIVVDADDLVQELKQLSLKEIEKRYENLSKDEMNERAEKIAMAALHFFILKYDFARDFLFDPEKSISFEGETGPYVLYSYARICAIFNKAIEEGIDVPYNPDKDKINTSFFLEDIDYDIITHENEISLLELLYKYPNIVSEAVNQLKPHLIARNIYEIGQEFAKFYHNCHILNEGEKLRKVRLLMVESVRRVIKHSFSLLSIDLLNKM